MAKEEIVNGIKVALDKGQSLRDAMISFFNSGYKREDINDAAREVLSLTDSSGI
jgi:adenosylmethionine-8-amino-7-oxononanoate aminotransferase